jgi:hypothetical protein
MNSTVFRAFDLEEGSTPAMRYQILVRFRGVIVENIVMDTMLAAKAELERRGYVTREQLR